MILPLCYTILLHWIDIDRDWRIQNVWVRQSSCYNTWPGNRQLHFNEFKAYEDGRELKTKRKCTYTALFIVDTHIKSISVSFVAITSIHIHFLSFSFRCWHWYVCCLLSAIDKVLRVRHWYNVHSHFWNTHNKIIIVTTFIPIAQYLVTLLSRDKSLREPSNMLESSDC